MPDDRRQEFELNQFWNELARGEPVAASDVDPELAETIRRLRTMAKAQPPVSARERVRRGLTEQFGTHRNGKETTMYATRTLTLPSSSLGLDGHARTTTGHTRRARSGIRWLSVQFATAVLLIVTLLGIYLVFNNHNHRAVQPGTPEASPSSDVPMYRGNLARTGEMPGPAPSNQPTLLWHYENLDLSVASAPVIVDGVVYVSEEAGYPIGVDISANPEGRADRTLAVDSASGSVVWEFTFEGAGSKYSFPAVASGLVFVNSFDGNLYAIDAVSGVERWRFPTGFWWISAPAVDDDVVYAAGGNNSNTEATLYAIDAESGEKLWEYKFEGSAGSSPAVADGTIYLGSTTGNKLPSMSPGSAGGINNVNETSGGMHAIDVKTGEQRWFVPTSKGVAATPTVADGVVFVGDLGDVLYALDAGTGEIRWSEELDPNNSMPSATGAHTMISASASVANGVVYLGTFDGVIHAFDANTGDEIWTATATYGLFRPVTVAGDTVLVGTTDGNVLALDAANGATRWQAETPSSGSSSLSSPTVVDGVVYVGAANAIYALSDVDTSAAATSAGD